jgi:hypothetical protein
MFSFVLLACYYRIDYRPDIVTGFAGMFPHVYMTGVEILLFDRLCTEQVGRSGYAFDLFLEVPGSTFGRDTDYPG